MKYPVSMSPSLPSLCAFLGSLSMVDLPVAIS